MQKRRALLRILLADLFFFAILHSILSVILYIDHHDSRPAVWALLLVLPLSLMILVRLRAKNIFVFFLLLALPVVLTSVLPIAVGMKVYMLIGVGACALYCVVVRLRGSMALDFGMVGFWLIFNMLQVQLAGFAGMQEASLFAGYWAVVMILCHLIYVQTLRADAALEVLQNSIQSRIQSVLQFNNRILAAFLVPLALVLGFIGLVPTKILDNFLLQRIGSVVLGFFRWLKSLEHLFRRKSPSEPEVSEIPPVVDSGELTLRDVEWIRMLYQGIIWLISALVILAVVLLVVYALYRLYRQFYNSKPLNGDERESLLPDLRLEDLPGFLRSLRRGPHFGRSERQQIRRQYYRKVQRLIRKGAQVRATDTAWEIAGKVGAQDGDIPALTAAYNTARYSRED